MKFALSKTGRSTTSPSGSSSTGHANNGSSSNSNKHTVLNWSQPAESQHPDLPLRSRRPLQSGPRPRQSLHRSTSVSDRFIAGYAGDRRSIAAFDQGSRPSDHYAEHLPGAQARLSGGLTRSQTVLRRESCLSTAAPPPYYEAPLPAWAPEVVQLPTPHEHFEVYPGDDGVGDGGEAVAPMSAPPGKTSSDSGQGGVAGLDRWSQRRLQRLNTEQGFREQRQGSGAAIASPHIGGSSAEPGSIYHHNISQQQQQQQHASASSSYATDHHPTQPPHQPQQQHPAPASSAYQNTRSTPTVSELGSTSSTSRSPSFAAAAHHHPSPDPTSAYVASSSSPHPAADPQHRPPTSASSSDLPNPLATSRSYGHDDMSSSAAPSHPNNNTNNSNNNSNNNHNNSSSSSNNNNNNNNNNNGALPAPKAIRQTGNRQSVHNGLSVASTRDGGVPAFNASVVPGAATVAHGQGYSATPKGDVGRVTPQPLQVGEDMSEEDVNQLIKDHKELRDKYTKVKKYYFEKEDQVKQLQNSLAHQRLSQSRTSLDDSEYTTRFNRLDGLIAQLAFNIRKSWHHVPAWLEKSVNRDAVEIGKQEMTAAGRAVIARWIVDNMFGACFHPDLDATLSQQLRAVQRNIRAFAPPAQTMEEEEFLTAKVVNWRLSTLEGLQDVLRSPDCAVHRARLTERWQDELIRHLAAHLQDPPPADLEGGVHMIVELVVSIAIHLPLESREVVIEYYPPGHVIWPDQMKVETGIPGLGVSVYEAAAAAEAGEEGAGGGSAEPAAQQEEEGGASTMAGKKRSMLHAITGTGKSSSSSSGGGLKVGKGGSSNSLGSGSQSDSSYGAKEEGGGRVRMAIGVGVRVRQRGILVKAPVFGM